MEPSRTPSASSRSAATTFLIVVGIFVSTSHIVVQLQEPDGQRLTHAYRADDHTIGTFIETHQLTPGNLVVAEVLPSSSTEPLPSVRITSIVGSIPNMDAIDHSSLPDLTTASAAANLRCDETHPHGNTYLAHIPSGVQHVHPPSAGDQNSHHRSVPVWQQLSPAGRACRHSISCLINCLLHPDDWRFLEQGMSDMSFPVFKHNTMHAYGPKGASGWTQGLWRNSWTCNSDFHTLLGNWAEASQRQSTMTQPDLLAAIHHALHTSGLVAIPWPPPATVADDGYVFVVGSPDAIRAAATVHEHNLAALSALPSAPAAALPALPATLPLPADLPLPDDDSPQPTHDASTSPDGGHDDAHNI